MNGDGVRQISIRSARFSTITASAWSAAVVSAGVADKTIPSNTNIVFIASAPSS